MKYYPFPASVLPLSNKIYSHSDGDWSTVLEGSLIKFDADNDFYTVVSKQKKLFIKEFSKIDPRKIEIGADIGVSFCERDSIDISYKKYKISTIRIINGGSGFSHGDLVGVYCGKTEIKSVDGLPDVGILKVESTGKNGEILSASINESGSYTEHPKGEFINLDNGVVLDVEFELHEERGMLEGSIRKVEVAADKTVLHLEYILPHYIKQGKISCNKWELTISNGYAGTPKKNDKYRIINDFTPNMGFPLPPPNTPQESLIALFRQTLMILDKRIAKLEEDLKNKS